MKYFKQIVTGFTLAVTLQGSILSMQKKIVKKSKIKPIQKQENIKDHVENTKRLVLQTLFTAMKIQHNSDCVTFILQRNGHKCDPVNNFFPVPNYENKNIPYPQVPLYFLCEALNTTERVIKHYDKIKDNPSVIYYSLSRSLFPVINYLAWFSGQTLLASEEKQVLENYKTHYLSLEQGKKKSLKELLDVLEHFFYMTTKLLATVINVFYGFHYSCGNEKKVTKMFENFFEDVDKKAFFKQYKKFTKGTKMLKC